MPNMLLEFESGTGNRFRFANMVLANIVLISRRSCTVTVARSAALVFFSSREPH